MREALEYVRLGPLSVGSLQAVFPVFEFRMYPCHGEIAEIEPEDAVDHGRVRIPRLEGSERGTDTRN